MARSESPSRSPSAWRRHHTERSRSRSRSRSASRSRSRDGRAQHPPRRSADKNRSRRRSLIVNHSGSRDRRHADESDSDEQRHKKSKKAKKEKKSKKSKKERQKKSSDSDGDDSECEPTAIAQDKEHEDPKQRANADDPDTKQQQPLDVRSFFERIKAQEAGKETVGTVHASGFRAPNPTSLVAQEQWECVKRGCGQKNNKKAAACSKCGAMKRLSEWR